MKLMNDEAIEETNRDLCGDILQWCIRKGLRLLIGASLISLRILQGIGLKKRGPLPEQGCEILLTGTFNSENWVMAHIKPLAMSKHCAQLTIVSVQKIPPLDNVKIIYPASWLVILIGKVPARLVTLLLVSLQTRPHIVGGFHLMFNGLAAAMVAPLIGARSLYSCCGGPMEVIGGGIHSENRLFGMLKKADICLEKKLLESISFFDIIITRGIGAAQYFKSKGVQSKFYVVHGGVDDQRFFPSSEMPTIDLIWTGRLVPIKRVDIFLGAIKLLMSTFPDINAVLVGDGPLLQPLEELACQLGVADNVQFIGCKNEVEKWIKQAKVFVLTSESEGLSLSMIEAMLCGLPVVVSDVGDLGDLVEDGVNGFLVPERTPDAFASRIQLMLTSPAVLTRFSNAASQSSDRCKVSNVCKLWDNVFCEDPQEAV